MENPSPNRLDLEFGFILGVLFGIVLTLFVLAIIHPEVFYGIL